MKFKFRDLLAIPFIFVALVLVLLHYLFLYIASILGGVWSGIVILTLMKTALKAPQAEATVTDVKITPVPNEEEKPKENHEENVR